jgi:rhomboid family GlyGly-CTERM serine protease
LIGPPAAAARPWLGLALLLVAGSLLAWTVPAAGLDWQPGLASSQPWRAWTAAFVHWSPLHLGANVLGAVVVAALGWAGQAPPRAAAAWAAAWPLTQWGLLLRPELAHFGGLSGVLHAGVAVVVVWLVVRTRGRPRMLGAAIGLGLLAKILLETPWGPTLRHGNGWDIAVAPLAHATGALAGLVCGLVGCLWCALLARPWRRQSAG